MARLYYPFDSFIARMGSVRRARRGAEREKHGPRMPGAGGLALRGILRAPRLLNEAVDALGTSVLRGSRLILIFETGDASGTGVTDAADDLAGATVVAGRYGAEPLGEAPARHWLEHRYGVSYRQSPVFMSGAFSDTMEVAATWSRLGALYDGVRAALGRSVFVMAHLSHAYPDGCSIYFTFAGSAATPDAALAKYDATWKAALDAAIAAGGTLSHHHGVGRSKAPKLGAELGLGVEVVHALRGVFDPAGIMNPGNLLPRPRYDGGAETPKPPGAPPAREAPRVPTDARMPPPVHARGPATLVDVERALAADGLTLGARRRRAASRRDDRRGVDRVRRARRPGSVGRSGGPPRRRVHRAARVGRRARGAPGAPPRRRAGHVRALPRRRGARGGDHVGVPARPRPAPGAPAGDADRAGPARRGGGGGLGGAGARRGGRGALRDPTRTVWCVPWTIPATRPSARSGPGARLLARPRAGGYLPLAP